MKAMDLRVLCTALGFTALVIQGGRVPKKEGARRALEFAGLIEDFCRISLPQGFERTEGENMPVVDFVSAKKEGRFARAGRMAMAIMEIMREQGGCMPQDLAAKGFTHEEIDRYWAMAKALATVELKIMDS